MTGGPAVAEAARLAALASYHLLDTPPEAAYDDIVALAAAVCAAPTALIGLVDEERHWFKARLGVEPASTPRAGSFGEQHLGRPTAVVVPDVTRDPRFAGHPSVMGGPGFRSYAGAPLITADGHVLGSLSVLDVRPRELTGRQVELLEMLARQVMTQLELRRQAVQLLLVTAERAVADSRHAETRRVLSGVLEQADVAVHARPDGPPARADRTGHELFGPADGHRAGRNDRDVAPATGEASSVSDWPLPLPAAVPAAPGSAAAAAAPVATAASEGRWQALMEKSAVAVAVYGAQDLRLRYANPPAGRLHGAAHPRDLLGSSVRHVFPVSADLRVARIQAGGTVVAADTRIVGLDGVTRDVEVNASPVTWDGEPAVQVEMRDVTARAAVPTSLPTSEQRFRALFDSAPVGIAECLPDGSLLSTNPELCRMLGHQAHELVGVPWMTLVHPDDRSGAQDGFQAVATSLGSTTYSAERHYVHRDGTVVPVMTSLAAVGESDGGVQRVVITVVDVSDQRRTERALQLSEHRFRQAFVTSPMGMVISDWPADGPPRLVQINRRACDLLGRRPDEVRAGGLAAFLDPRDVAAHARAQQRLYTGGADSVRLELRFVSSAGDTVRVRLAATVVPASDGQDRQLVTLLEDVTAQRLSEAAVTELHSAGSDLPRAWRAVVHMAVPAHGDVAFVQSVTDRGALQTQSVLHTDRTRQSDAHALVDAYPRRLGSATGPGRAAASGGELIDRDGEHQLTDREAATWDALGVIGTISVPMHAYGRLIGVLTVARLRGSAPYLPQDVALVEALCARAAPVLGNTDAHNRHRNSSLALQNALLPDVVRRIQGIELAARYLPAGAGLGQVAGGDWYDAATDRRGITSLLVGDVAGHDINAAASMGQLRAKVRMASHDGSLSPAGVLTAVDDSTRDHGTSVFATALIARIHLTGQPATTPAGTAATITPAGAGLTVTWSSAGHPAPLVLRADGSLDDDVHRSDRALGVDLPSATAPPRHDHVVTLDAGETLVLYTDGLIERRDRDLETGVLRLRAAPAAMAHLPLEELCDGVLEQLEPDGTDDITLFVLRAPSPPS